MQPHAPPAVDALTLLLQVYDLPFAASGSSRIGMSSYPLTIVSSDDFVYTDQQVHIARCCLHLHPPSRAPAADGHCVV